MYSHGTWKIKEIKEADKNINLAQDSNVTGTNIAANIPPESGVKFEGGDDEKNDKAPVDPGDIELEEVKADSAGVP